MNIFNSLGSNYNFSYVISSIFGESKGSKEKLVKLLENKYSGKAALTYKGRQALELALEYSKIKKGSGVVVTGFTCIAVVDAIEKQNLQPIYLDIDPKTLNFTSELFEKKLEKDKNIKAVIIQNTLGYPCDIAGIESVCKKHKLVLIEDLAHSVGTVYADGREAGTVGDFVAFSFSQDKAVDGVSGGALLVKSEKLKVKSLERNNSTSIQDRMYPLLTWIIRKTYLIGFGKILHATVRVLHLLSDPMKSMEGKTMSDWHAKLALDEFSNLEKTLSHRRKIAKIYAVGFESKLKTDQATNLRFPIIIQNRDKIIAKLKKHGVHVSDIWYDAPVAPVRFLGRARYPMNSCPQAEEISKTILNLPTHINVLEKDAYEIVRIIHTWYN